MLISSFEHNIDAKGRVFIPAKWREDLGSTIIITRDIMGKGDGRCLFGMSLNTWQTLLERFNNVAMSDVTVQKALRMTFANACECELDAQGRILISSGLRQYANLEKEAVLIGMGNRIEIWSKSEWENQLEENDGLSEDVLKHLQDLGI